MNSLKPCLLLLLCFSLNAAGADLAAVPKWAGQVSTVSANLRGISAASDSVVWASGTDNTVIRTDDGGATWKKVIFPAEMVSTPLDFRDIDAVNEKTAYLLSIGEATASRIYKTTDAGAHWKLQYMNQDSRGFLDSMTFWDADHGLVIGDSIDGHFQILITANGGTTWSKVPDSALPAALPDEGAFSASGSNIAMTGKNNAWIGLSAAGSRSRVLHTEDRGKTWSITDVPVATNASSGIFSVAFRDAQHGAVVGGDYKNESAAVDNVAITGDGGKSWTLVTSHALSGYRSAVKYLPGNSAWLIAVGPSGVDLSQDDGTTWQPLAYPETLGGYHAISFAPGHRTAWVCGKSGGVARLKFD